MEDSSTGVRIAQSRAGDSNDKPKNQQFAIPSTRLAIEGILHACVRHDGRRRWMVVIDDWLTRGGAAGAMLGFLIGGLVLIPIGYVYGRLTERMPDAGSEIAYTGAVFAKSVSFATGWMMTLAYLIVCPYEAVAIGRVGSYVFPH